MTPGALGMHLPLGWELLPSFSNATMSSPESENEKVLIFYEGTDRPAEPGSAGSSPLRVLVEGLVEVRLRGWKLVVTCERNP